MKFPGRPFKEPKLVVIPIVDVMLAVFLFLAIIAFNNQLVSVFVNLPQGEGKAVNVNSLSISVDKNGRYMVGKKVYTLQELERFLKEKKPMLVNVMADEKTPYKYVAELLSELQKLGITNVNLVLRKKV
jgi:biopolymer transport protein ExbD